MPVLLRDEPKEEERYGGPRNTKPEYPLDIISKKRNPFSKIIADTYPARSPVGSGPSKWSLRIDMLFIIGVIIHLLASLIRMPGAICMRWRLIGHHIPRGKSRHWWIGDG